MAENVKLILEGVDKITPLLVKTGNSFKKLETQMKKVSDTNSFDKLRDKISNVQTSAEKAALVYSRLTNAVNKNSSAVSKNSVETTKATNSTNRLSVANDRLTSSTNKSILSIGKQGAALRSTIALGRTASAVLGTLFALRSSTTLITGLIQTADAFKVLEARTNSIAKSTGDVNNRFELIAKSANTAGIEIKPLVDIYTRVALATKDLGLNSAETTVLLDNIGKAAIASGASQANLRAGLIQLSQAFSSGIVRAEEMNSILENIPFVANVVAEQLGVTSGQLRKLVLDGAISSKIFAEALINSTDEINAAFEPLKNTLTAQLNRVSNSFQKFVKDSVESSGLLNIVSDSLDKLTASINSGDLDLKPLFEGVAKFIEDIGNQIPELLNAFSEITSTGGTILGVFAKFPDIIDIVQVLAAGLAAKFVLAKLAARDLGATTVKSLGSTAAASGKAASSADLIRQKFIQITGLGQKQSFERLQQLQLQSRATAVLATQNNVLAKSIAAQNKSFSDRQSRQNFNGPDPSRLDKAKNSAKGLATGLRSVGTAAGVAAAGIGVMFLELAAVTAVFSLVSDAVSLFNENSEIAANQDKFAGQVDVLRDKISKLNEAINETIIARSKDTSSDAETKFLEKSIQQEREKLKLIKEQQNARNIGRGRLSTNEETNADVKQNQEQNKVISDLQEDLIKSIRKDGKILEGVLTEQTQSVDDIREKIDSDGGSVAGFKQLTIESAKAEKIRSDLFENFKRQGQDLAKADGLSAKEFLQKTQDSLKKFEDELALSADNVLDQKEISRQKDLKNEISKLKEQERLAKAGAGKEIEIFGKLTNGKIKTQEDFLKARTKLLKAETKAVEDQVKRQESLINGVIGKLKSSISDAQSEIQRLQGDINSRISESDSPVELFKQINQAQKLGRDASSAASKGDIKGAEKLIQLQKEAAQRALSIAENREDSAKTEGQVRSALSDQNRAKREIEKADKALNKIQPELINQLQERVSKSKELLSNFQKQLELLTNKLTEPSELNLGNTENILKNTSAMVKSLVNDLSALTQESDIVSNSDPKKNDPKSGSDDVLESISKNTKNREEVLKKRIDANTGDAEKKISTLADNAKKPEEKPVDADTTEATAKANALHENASRTANKKVIVTEVQAGSSVTPDQRFGSSGRSKGGQQFGSTGTNANGGKTVLSSTGTVTIPKQLQSNPDAGISSGSRQKFIDQLDNLDLSSTRNQRLAGGGLVRGTGGPTADKNTIQASKNEFMVRAARVKELGLGFMNDVNGSKPISDISGGNVSPSTQSQQRSKSAGVINVPNMPPLSGDFDNSSVEEFNLALKRQSLKTGKRRRR
jgi:tape measure domain-containing protein